MSKLRPLIRCSTEIGPWTDPVLVVHLPLGNIVRHHGLEFHLYANNTQLYFAFRLSTAEQQSSLARIEACAGHIDSWLVQNKLKLNTEKTELLILNASYRPPSIQCSARNIGVVYDQEMTLVEHVTAVCKTCFLHLRSIGNIRDSLSQRHWDLSSCFYFL